MDPPVIPVVESRDFVEEPFEDDFVEVPIVDDRCEITAWRGYAKPCASMVASTPAPAKSPWSNRGRSVRQARGTQLTSAAKAAHEELTARLVSEGWVPVEEGRSGFESSFIRQEAQEPAAPAPGIAQHEVLEPDAVT